MATPHISAKKNEIAKFVAMAGDPLRVKLFVKNYMTETKLVSDVRGILAYTGKVNGKEITVMAHGMGFGSMGIYVWELFEYYEVERIIRFGSAGAYSSDVNVLDFHIVTESWTDNNFGEAYGAKNITTADKEMAESAINFAKNRLKDKRNIITGKTHSTPWFYRSEKFINPSKMEKEGIKTVEMESYALYAIADLFKRKALTVLTISDHLVDDSQNLSADERRTAFTDMFDIVSDMAGKFGQ